MEGHPGKAMNGVDGTGRVGGVGRVDGAGSLGRIFVDRIGAGCVMVRLARKLVEAAENTGMPWLAIAADDGADPREGTYAAWNRGRGDQIIEYAGAGHW